MAKSKTESNVSKTDMVKEAMRELGDAGPKELQRYIVDHHGVEIATTMISSYKSNIRRKSGDVVASSGDNKVGAVGVRDIATIRELIDRLGVSELQQLVKVLAKK